MLPSTYLLAGQASEAERLQLQSLMWEDAGRRLLSKLPDGHGKRALDAGCGALGWLRVLAAWTGTHGEVVGTDIDQGLLKLAAEAARPWPQVRVLEDDLFASTLPASHFDLVHARFQLAPLGRAREQLAAYLRLLRPGGWLVLADPDIGSWRLHPDDGTYAALVDLLARAFSDAGGNLDAGASHPALLRKAGLQPQVQADVLTLGPGHPYLALPLQFARALRPRLLQLCSESTLERLEDAVRNSLARPDCWGTSFTLLQTYARVPDGN